MALAPKFAAQKLSVGVTPPTLHTVEMYLDYVCPFSKKMFNTIYTGVFPLVEKKYPGKIQFIFRHQVQPWHPSSTLTHEAGVAVLKLAPQKFWPFSKALFDVQIDFFDVNVVGESRIETYKRLAKIAGSVGVDESKILELLYVDNKPKGDSYNIGNAVTDDLKLLVKAARLTGVHVSPTVLFNGIEERSIGSSMTVEDWEQWIQKNIV